MEVGQILWRFSNIECPKNVSPLIRLDLQSHSSYQYPSGVMVARLPINLQNAGSNLQGNSCFLHFYRRLLKKEITLSKMIFHYFDNELSIFTFAKKSHQS